MLNPTSAEFVQGKDLASIVIFTPTPDIGDKFAVVTNMVTVVKGTSSLDIEWCQCSGQRKTSQGFPPVH